MMEKTIGVQEVADLLDVTPETIRAWREEGYGPPSYKIGRKIRFEVTALDQWIEEQKRATSR